MEEKRFKIDGEWMRDPSAKSNPNKSYKGKFECITITVTGDDVEIKGDLDGKKGYNNYGKGHYYNTNQFEIEWKDTPDSPGKIKEKRKTKNEAVSEGKTQQIEEYQQIEKEEKRSSYGNWVRKK
ncbi:MAG: hypothetical protein M0Q94_14580 [Candidatus Cloacimonetes bacterium]|nr:hypothetical protein [Candidatus Cloacimonadota bacterium]